MHTSWGFINVFNRRATGFHNCAKVFEVKFFIRKLSSRWSNQAGKINLTASQFACCLALNETPSSDIK